MTAAQAPFVGKGRWTLPLQLLSDSSFMSMVVKLGETKWKAAGEVLKSGNRSSDKNPQSLFKEFKDELLATARQRMKEKVPKLKAAITSTTKQIKSISENKRFSTDPELQREFGILRERLRDLERRRHGQIQASTTARYVLNAECPSKYWSAVNRDKTPRDLFYCLRDPASDPPKYISRSSEMAELARNYHNSLQSAGVTDIDEANRMTKIIESLDNVGADLSTDDAHGLSLAFTREEVRDSIKKAGPGKASGLDGIPYELWLALDDQWQGSSSKAEHRFDCLDFMCMLYEDINKHGVSADTGFADGWMCPLYKKKDKRDIANYRPITLLNSDYKVYTRIYATRLGGVVGSIVHPDQAGFIQKRQISDQTQMCRVMVDYAEALEENGAIIALDQEKAYDKIRHDYLWKVLERFGVPKKVIDRLKSLYEHATTVVIVNGVEERGFRLSKPSGSEGLMSE
ncbi:hypothetical protein EVJ58_g9397 [Rhodofomes roseus]|uniref:Reverse transcriptase domain-containing protein n=1 Tax=Rhodofomes roseus TaxID=34475 RepID=A0A4Y9XU17_9APHY|nr:hypothetical protein EVJ58_g9397 [Rhodofomes roseus]